MLCVLYEAKANHREQRKETLKDKLKDAESTYKDAKVGGKEYVKRRNNEIIDRYDRKFSDNLRAKSKTLRDNVRDGKFGKGRPKNAATSNEGITRCYYSAISATAPHCTVD
ncbi:hypothetical protein EVAR_82393_1 [Eumeta japonica]|uniref:Uncharacterized protein n=1 Tax=Eumeta variegata TaxID=151549 RepID=A0A4C1UA92_EUMVA|nr:hypothetical protein EVAR_82393_1 [Eumeta japonica]